ncbi:hypothetical protein [Staphylococcus saprophyticus]|uniref:hypothetical protein n=1 Tax=Staphylococcus saprophyticus TaxID=29385 RepID=UPI0012485F13|nr:hypothetical protein [Staphylococcus saprophyticus]
MEEGGEMMEMGGGERVIRNEVCIEGFKEIGSRDILSGSECGVYDGIREYGEELREKEEGGRGEEMELEGLWEGNVDIEEEKSILKEML